MSKLIKVCDLKKKVIGKIFLGNITESPRVHKEVFELIDSLPDAGEELEKVIRILAKSGYRCPYYSEIERKCPHYGKDYTVDDCINCIVNWAKEKARES